MPRRLSDNLNSSYFEAANRLASKDKRRRVVAYVESYDDIFFWRQILSQFEDASLRFEVMLPSKARRLERGKKAALMRLLSAGVGEAMIACVDADYDYLEQGATPMSKEIISNPYIFHTYAYAIENLQCYAPTLHNVCVAATLNDHEIFDIERYLTDFSEAIYPLFIWSIWHYRTPNYSRFSISDFLRVIETGHFTFAGADDIIRNIRRKVGKKVEALKLENPNAKESFARVKEDLRQLGVTPQNTYLYIQGHHLFEKVVMPMMNKICDKLIRERENEIARGSVHGTQRRNELSCYTHSLQDLSAMLKKNSGFMLSPQMASINADLKRFKEMITKKPQDEQPV